ncbi:DUF2750 domain-containing protein [Flavobacterium suzhouense]|uniref:DUF2750 domain-containing protein n=1 Tax=Flavobacterium suzhouense TaxID=1529638 RepID=A0ABW5NQB7_9FLAO
MINASLPSDRYKHFLQTIIRNNELWTLINNDGSFALFEVNNTIVFSLWPDEASIESNLTPDWTDYIPFKIDFNALEETVLPIIRQNNYLINIYPVEGRIGHVVSLNDFVTDLNTQYKH